MSARILIIEDNPANMELMTYLLQAFGHTVLSAYNGEEGVETARRELPDLIICDVHLPKMDGYDVLEQLKRRSGEALLSIPVIAVTALAMVGDRQKLLAAGFDGYLGKPIEPELFVSQVEQYIDHDLHSTISIVAPNATVEDSSAPHPVRNGCILVVDDLPANREFIRCALEPCGFQVVLASSAKDGLVHAYASEIDLILCDLRMPDEDGLVFIAQVKADPVLQAVPFVFISAALGEHIIQQCLQLGAVHFIQHPIEAHMLIREIEDCLRVARQ
ncbi:response regulator [Actimicrobium sp. CCI2.3]|uniref:response regulator n=1 Tax=Actimicrobium sp. CCI2.3 TaxID=3048616 RepID=UPI002AB522F0|nr:response regulator [Actimicrobium sp. CCI2.3]MDY7576701.1 response regulator [Actimicrobium sp. CCI2.3]MEB0023575.1 response regulator [Actimicrobium sp. CCI2.3]